LTSLMVKSLALLVASILSLNSFISVLMGGVLEPTRDLVSVDVILLAMAFGI
jgi:hypothetical protein